MTLTQAQRDALTFDDRGLIPAVVQQHDTGEVLMVAWMNATSLERTMELGETVFWSRSRGELWHKGATSAPTATVTRCSSSWTPGRVLPATPASARASTAVSRT